MQHTRILGCSPRQALLRCWDPGQRKVRWLLTELAKLPQTIDRSKITSFKLLDASAIILGKSSMTVSYQRIASPGLRKLGSNYQGII